MDNENKDLEFEPQEENVTAEEIAEEIEEETAEEAVEETEFDPTESEDFYSNLEAAISGADEPETDDLPELLLSEDLFGGVEEEEFSQPADSSIDDELFAGVDAALTEQIENEFGRDTEISSTEEGEPNKAVSGWRAIPTWTKVLVGVILVILISVGLLFGTKGGRKLVYNVIVDIAFKDLKVDDDDKFESISPIPELTVTISPEPTAEPTQSPDITPEPTTDPNQNPEQNPNTTPEPTVEPDVTLTPTPTPKPAIKIMDDEDVINILLLGEENLFNARRGRTDAIIVVSINLNGGPLKMISFQRDLYVSIPGYPDDKLNASYAFGGSKLIMSTIEQNFGIDIDGYVKIGFDGFETIIDQLGGLRLSLTARESEYLNTTKYISKPEERNTVAGYQDMTGAQVLGYCRVRFVPTADGLSNDFGRNYRHRVVLQALFDKFKGQNITQLRSIMDQCFSYVTVSSGLDDLAKECLFAVVENKMFDINTMQIPINNLYSDPKINGKDVIVANPENVDRLQDFLYGDN